jgi:hypothetical protein
MPQAISLLGLDLRIEGSILEMRPEGDRTPQHEKEGAKLFAMLCSKSVQGILIDLRTAFYHLDDIGVEERTRLVAKGCAGRAVAYVARTDQEALVEAAILRHSKQNSESHRFVSAKLARNWLNDRVGAMQQP